MKKKIAYLTITAVVGVTAFFVGKNFTEQHTQPETIPENLERIELTAEKYGLYLEYTDGTSFYNFWIPTEDLERAGLIDTAHIIDWNTDGKELSIMTANGCEWYAYQSENVYQNRNFIPVVEER